MGVPGKPGGFKTFPRETGVPGKPGGFKTFPRETGVPGKPGGFKTPILFFLERKKRMRLLMV